MSPDAYIILGIFLSLLFSELTGISPGGLIVPGFIAMHLREPSTVALTLAVSLLTLVLLRLASRWMLLYGRRRFAAYVTVAFALGVLSQALLPSISPSFGGIKAIGWLIPGIIASDMDKQGPVKTSLALGAVAGLVSLAGSLWS